LSIDNIHPQTMQRLTLYLHYLLPLTNLGNSTVSRDSLAERLHLNPKLVRKDLELLYPSGKPKEYNVSDLIQSINQYIQCDRVTPVVLVGVGKLGKALMSYAGFTVFELDILAGFDVDADIIKKGVAGKPVYPMEKLNATCQRLDAKIGIITVPGGCAQSVCDMLVEAGVVAIWNFAAIRLTAPEHVMVINEDMSKSLVRLFDHARKMESDKFGR